MKLLKTAIAFALILSEVTAFEDDMPRDGEFRLSPPQSLVGMRIVNGAPSPFMPEWMSYLYKPNYMYNFGCGATVIGKNLVMTAAHCAPQDARAIVANQYDISSNSLGIWMPVQAVRLHPLWVSSRPQFNDIALVKVSNGETVKRTRLFGGTTSELNPNNLTAFGWGSQGNGTPVSRILLAALMPPYGDEQCSAINPFYAVPEILCAGGQGPFGTGVCYGDSGGFIGFEDGRNPGTWYQAGVAAWTMSDCNPMYPSGFTRVRSFLTWILDTAKELANCPAGTQFSNDLMECVGNPITTTTTGPTRTSSSSSSQPTQSPNPCPDFAFCQNGTSSCAPGYQQFKTSTFVRCDPCPPGTYKDNFGNDPCYTCPPNVVCTSIKQSHCVGEVPPSRYNTPPSMFRCALATD